MEKKSVRSATAFKAPEKPLRRDRNGKPRLKFHVCIPLYRGIPKELQSGWTRMGAHGVAEWNNSTDLLPWLARNPKMDTGLYCGTCGRRMVKNRNLIDHPIEDSKKIKLV